MDESKKQSEERRAGQPPVQKKTGSATARTDRSGKRKPRSGSGEGRGNRRARRRTWYQTHGRDLKFLAIFAVLMGLYYLASTTSWTQDRFFPWYLLKNAEVSGAVVHAFGYEDMDLRGNALVSPRGSISVGRGCYAIEPAALFVSAVLASPARFWSRLSAALIGTVLLMVVNLIRIITLFLTNIHWKKAFDIMHLDVWQAAFILLAILLWAFWASWATGKRTRLKPDAPS